MFKSNKIMNNIYIIEKNKYYRIKAKITGYSLIHQTGFNNDYVEYTIKIKTDYGNWHLKKRYEDFSKLNDELISKFPEINEYFPPKRFFKNSESTIKESIKYFNKYLKYITNKINIFLFKEIVNFMNIDLGILDLIIKKYSMLKINLEENYIYGCLTRTFEKYKLEKMDKKEEDKDNNFFYLNSDNYYNSIFEYEKSRQRSSDWDEDLSISPSSFVIREFLYNLCEENSNKDDIIKTFESFLQQRTKWINFSNKDITELFLGFEESFEDNTEEKIILGNKKEVESKKTIILFQWLNENQNKDNNEETLDSDSDEEEKYGKKIPGLFQQIGDYKNNIFSAISSLNLLEKLLNDQYNPYYEKYMNIFINMKLYQFDYMKLNDIIKNNIGGNKTNLKAIKILAIIFSNKKIAKYQNEIIKDKSVYNEYINFLNNFSE